MTDYMLSLPSHPNKALNMYVALGIPKTETNPKGGGGGGRRGREGEGEGGGGGGEGGGECGGGGRREHTAQKVNKSLYFKKKIIPEVYTFYLG